MSIIRWAVQASTVAIAPVLAASTYVVDDSGGPGVHFTSISAAVAASVNGDILLVRPGAYSAFTLDKALTIVADDGVSVGTGSQITGVSTLPGVRLSGLDFADLRITLCTAPVLCDRTDVLGALSATSANSVLTIQSSADVRFHRSTVEGRNSTSEGIAGRHAASVVTSRVEFSSSTIAGGNGKDADQDTDGSDGGDGLYCGGGSRVHLARSDVSGGAGGDACSALCSGTDGDGGNAVVVEAGANAIIAGSSNQEILGGAAGGISSNGFFGWGVLVWGGGTLRYSGVTIQSGDPWEAPINAVAGSSVTQASPPDPTLELTGIPTPGAPMTARLYATPGYFGRMQQGNQALVVDDGLATIEKLNNRIRLHPLGQVPSNGTIVYPLSVPSPWQPGTFRVFQGLEIDAPTNMLVGRTNSVLVVVR